MEEQGLDWDKLEMQFMPQGSENGCKYDAGVTIGLGMSGIMGRMPTGLWARDLPTAAARDLPTAAAPAAEEEASVHTPLAPTFTPAKLALPLSRGAARPPDEVKRVGRFHHGLFERFRRLRPRSYDETTPDG